MSRLTLAKLSVTTFSPTSTVEDPQLALQHSESIPQDQQRLIVAGKQLEESRTLADYNIQNKCYIHMVLRLKGC